MREVIARLAFLLIALVLLLWLLPRSIGMRVDPSGPPATVSSSVPAPLSQLEQRLG